MSSSEKREDNLSNIFFAISDPTRRRILELLLETDLYPNEIHAIFKFSLPTISNHLRVLFDCGLVTRERESQKVKYSINLIKFKDAQIWLETFGQTDFIDYDNIEYLLETLAKGSILNK